MYRNMYESYLLGAVKFSVYCREIWRTNKNRPICTSTVLEVIHRAYNDLDVPSVSKLRMDIRRGLYLRAFIKVLVRRQHLFCEAVQVLEQEQRNLTLGAGMISQMIHRWPATHLERLA
ncbi:hypothetical protein BX666DRAFT_392812 [Dichotomocladium elegans]|nr:hypothetical protein BX666DRAFT_392812 [Dichotomocladium elegans]